MRGIYEDLFPSVVADMSKQMQRISFKAPPAPVSLKAQLTRSELQMARSIAFAMCLGVVCVALVAWSYLGQIELLAGPPAWRAAARAAGPAFNATDLSDLDHLVMVAGHAVVLAEDLEGIDSREEAWFLETYQIGQELPAAFVGHIRAAVEAAAADPGALLVFSGGQTRPSAGPRDEGFSYYRVAEHFGWWGHGLVSEEPDVEAERWRLPQEILLEQQATAAATLQQARRSTRQRLPVPLRAVTEEYATDSFENLLFSVGRFREVVGRYPSKISVVSFSFKRNRFVDMHRLALRFPLERFSFIGLQPPRTSHFDLELAVKGELENSVKLFEADPYGCFSKTLQGKRKQRNPFRRTAPYPLSCPEIRDLLAWCGPEVFPGPLPWTGRRVVGSP